MMRGATILWAVLATIAGTGLFLLKYEVQTQEEHLREVRKDIVETEESIHVLKAEWSYLNEPLRLREEAERHLGLHPLKPSQIATIDSIPMAPPQQPGDQGPLAEGQPDWQAAPAAAPIPTPAQPGRPVEAQQQPKPPAKAPPAGKPTTPPRSMTTEKAVPAKTVVVAAAKPAAKDSARKLAAKPATQPVHVAQAQPANRPASAPVRTPYPSLPPPTLPTHVAAPVTTSGNVMVITSPALLAPDLASTRARQ